MSEAEATWWLDEGLGRDGLAAITDHIADRVKRDAKPLRKIGSPAMLLRSVSAALASDLHIDVLRLMADGWNKARELHECRQATFDKGGSAIVTLGGHSLSRQLRPRIIVTYGAQHTFDIDIGLIVAATFKGLELGIDRGDIVRVAAGKCEATAQLTMAGQNIDKPRVLKHWTLPGVYEFRPPLAYSPQATRRDR